MAKQATPAHLDAAAIDRDVRAVYDELDMRQLAVFARLSPTRRLEMMFDMCESARKLIIASEIARYPGISAEELARRVRARIALAYEL